MIFQPELNPQKISFPSTHTLPTPSPNYNRKCLNLSKEERLILRKQEKRRRKIQEIRAGCRRFMAMLFSHIGLSGLVIAYTLIGALIFGGIEKDYELEIKKDASHFRKIATLDLVDMVFEKLHRYILNSGDTCTDVYQLVNSISQLTEEKRQQISGEIKPDEINPKSEPNASLSCTNLNCTDLDIGDQNTTEIVTPEQPINPFHVKFFKDFEYVLGEYLKNYTKNVSSLMEDKGWNASEQLEDVKWSFAGAVLYAITVITTIGYGHTTPKTDAGKILTIFYALIGIPLVFLYLSNIGDYLADLFRTLYSRTCRAGCENYCSISIITSMFHSFVRRFRKRGPADLDEDTAAHVDVVTSTPHWQYRRRKRVLLRAINATETEIDAVVDKDKVQKEDSGADKTPSKIFEIIKHVKDFSNRIILPKLQKITPRERLRIYPFVSDYFGRAKNNVQKMMNPVSKWIHRMTQEFIFPVDTGDMVIENLNAVQSPDVREHADGVGSNALRPQLVTANIETMTPDKLFPNNVHSTPDEAPQSMTMDSGRLLSPEAEFLSLSHVGSASKTNERQARYFTYDGQHRKFYLSARYLRSVDRQRRHRRRLKQRTKEHARSQLNRLQNAMSYGTLRVSGKRNKIHAASTLPYTTLERLSLDSETLTDENIKLLCWKDIDLDLEVRSIDDESEFYRLLAKICKNQQKSSSRHSNSNRTSRFIDRLNGVGRQESDELFDSLQDIFVTKYTVDQTPDCKSVSSMSTKQCDKTYPRIITADNSTATSSKSSSDTLKDRQKSYPTQPINIMDKRHSYRPFENKIHPAISGKQTDSLKEIPRHSTNLYRKPDAENKYRKFTAYDATVIANPMTTLNLKGQFKNKLKSRLSFTSSIDELDSETQIELSYYSQEESVQPEEEESIFSFGEGYRSEEDISNVTVPISFSLLIMTTYIVIGAIVFSIWEDKMYLKWSYFCFITLSTIGFGDIVPGTKIDSQNTKEKMVIISLYVAIGLSVFAMCFKLMQEEVVDKVKWFAKKVGIIKKRSKMKAVNKPQ